MRWFAIGCMVLCGSVSAALGQSTEGPTSRVLSEEDTFLAAARAELAAEVQGPNSPANDPFVRTVGHEIGDPFQQSIQMAREQQPTPTPGYGFSGVSNYNASTDSESATVGIRLDKAYSILRETETIQTLSEHQNVSLFGGTILPIQTPCWVWGVRGMGGYVDQLSMISDSGAYSIDSFWGTRYKKLYHKIGFFIDGTDRRQKIGLSYGAMTELPILGTVTFDSAFGFRNSDDSLFPEVRDSITLRSRRVEQSDVDYQFRFGKYWNEHVQTGVTFNYYPFTWTQDEYGVGSFANLTFGRWRIVGDVTGGNEGLRGYIRLAMSWGVAPSERNRDPRVSDVDNVAWVTRPTERDPSMRLRESLTGPIPLAPP
ncbi:hypothetical protein K2X85_11870 [bacterium]|jgi:hypothetical protein|nr:hypothetical protein [bacterium]